MSQAIQNIFNRIAPNYDKLNRVLSFNTDKGWRKKAIEQLKDRPYPLILDLCAGTLDLSIELSQTYPNSQIIAVDFSLPMLESGRQKIPDKTHIPLFCGDGHRLPFQDDYFDSIICGFGIRNLDQKEQAVQEIRRVLKPGGRLVVLEFFKPSGILSKAFYQSYGRYVIPTLGGILGQDKAAYQYLQDSIQSFFSIQEYLDFLKKHGFQKTKSGALSGGVVHWLWAE
ncbi:MAG: bifunctional demethylmenaquinone methyltransferase/2-methoxy-6-polyprenyl-1,4-benzoquinol methylase UbiE [Deltaproteobacteria bacterium]|nr:bifunctional demethylmenaquinone methyltransferase/2-methoxy-6-polyprenyl-1,4-benzoquinol methylase UbiE [Deltaproteobacteria bacterium]